MNHFAKIAESLETQGLDAMLLTCEANRFYASGFHSSGTDGIALVTRRHNYYFTDNRYTEAAARSVQNAEIREVNRQHPYSALINAVIDAEGLKRIGYEDEYITVADWRRYTEKLHGELVPASALLWQLRAVKDAEERDCLIQAQRIAERALTETLNDIRPGVPRCCSTGCCTTARRTSPLTPLWSPAQTAVSPTAFPGISPFRPRNLSPWTLAASTAATAPT